MPINISIYGFAPAIFSSSPSGSRYRPSMAHIQRYRLAKYGLIFVVHSKDDIHCSRRGRPWRTNPAVEASCALLQARSSNHHRQSAINRWWYRRRRWPHFALWPEGRYAACPRCLIDSINIMSWFLLRGLRLRSICYDTGHIIALSFFTAARRLPRADIALESGVILWWHFVWW